MTHSLMSISKARVYVGRQKNAPSRKLCDEVLKRVAAENQCTVYDVVFSPTNKHVKVRWLVWSEILEESGCSIYGLAHVWGVDHTSILSGLKRLGINPQTSDLSTASEACQHLQSSRTVGDSERVTGALATPRHANAIT